MAKFVFQNKTGFTLIEIIVVLLLAGLLTAVAATRLIPVDDYRMHGEIDQLKMHLRFAQSRSIKTDDSWGIEIAGADSYYLFKRVNVLKEKKRLPGADGNDIYLSSLRMSTSPLTIEFDNFGSPGAADIIIATNGGTITVTGSTGFIP